MILPVGLSLAGTLLRREVANIKLDGWDFSHAREARMISFSEIDTESGIVPLLSGVPTLKILNIAIIH